MERVFSKNPPCLDLRLAVVLDALPRLALLRLALPLRADGPNLHLEQLGREAVVEQEHIVVVHLLAHRFLAQHVAALVVVTQVGIESKTCKQFIICLFKRCNWALPIQGSTFAGRGTGRGRGRGGGGEGGGEGKGWEEGEGGGEGEGGMGREGEGEIGREGEGERERE